MLDPPSLSMAAVGPFEIVFLKTGVVAPYEKSARRVKLRLSRPTRLVVPACVTVYPTSSSCPEPYLVRCLGSSAPHELRVCMAATHARRSVFHPMSVTRITWVVDFSKEPRFQKFGYSNHITGEDVGELHFQQKDMKDGTLPQLRSSLGNKFVFVLVLNRSITVTFSDRPTLYLSLSPKLIEVPSLEWEVVFRHQVQQSDPAKVLNTFHQLLLVCWKAERFDALRLIPIINRCLEEGEPLLEHIQEAAAADVRSKLTSLRLFESLFFGELAGQLERDAEFSRWFSQTHEVLLKEVASLGSFMGSDLLQSPKNLLHILSREIINSIPLDPAWWSQLQQSLSSEQLARFGELMTANKSSLSASHDYQSWIGDLAQFETSALFMYSVYSKRDGRPIPSRWRYEVKYYLFDPFSNMRLSDHPHLKLSTKYPSVSLRGATDQVFASYHIGMCVLAPNQFQIRPPNIKSVIVLAYSDSGLGAHLHQHAQTRVEWKVIARTGWLLAHNSRALPEWLILVYLEGYFDLNPLKSATSAGLFAITQVAASRWDLFVLRVQGVRNVLMRVPIVPNNAQVSLLKLEDKPAGPKSPSEHLYILQRLTLTDPGYSHPMCSNDPLKTLFLAEVGLEYLPGLPSGEIVGLYTRHECQRWRNFTELHGWIFVVQLSAVDTQPHSMQPRHSRVFRFPAPHFWLRTVGHHSLPADLFGNTDNLFVFWWQYLSNRMFGLWLREGGGSMIFVCKERGFQIVTQRSAKPIPLSECNKVAPDIFARLWIPTTHRAL